MSKITAKYQLTIPRAIAQSVGLKPGDPVTWEAAGDAVRLRAESVSHEKTRSVTDQLILFDLSTERADHRARLRGTATPQARGWSREELYEI